jgi:hypothetical protein
MTIEWTQGTTSEGLPILLQRRDGSAFNLSGRAPSDITVLMKRYGAGLPATFTPLAGTASIDDGPNGRITYQFADADVANNGRFLLLVKVNFSPKVYYSSAQEFIIASTTS